VTIRKVGFSDNLADNTVLVKEDDKYYAARIVRRCGWGNNPTYYYFNRSAKPFVPKVENGGVKLPAVPNPRGNDIAHSVKVMAAKEFYTVAVINEKGKSIKVG
jgi:hypothetical protein